MAIDEALQGLEKKAAKEEVLRQALLATPKSKTPVADFCRLAGEAGFPIS